MAYDYYSFNMDSIYTSFSSISFTFFGANLLSTPKAAGLNAIFIVKIIQISYINYIIFNKYIL